MNWFISYLIHGLAALLALLFLRICLQYIKWRTSPLRTLPGPRGKFFLLGEFLTIFREPFFAPHQRWWKACNYAPIMSYTSLFGRWVVIPTDPDIIKQILTAPSAQEPVRYYKDFVFFREIVGDGLVSLEGQSWSRHRRILQPCFQTGLIREALSAVVPTKVQNLIHLWKKSEGREIDIYTHMSVASVISSRHNVV